MAEVEGNKLKGKHELFCQTYIAMKMNGTKAYMKVYGVKENVARAAAARLLARVNIKQRIEELQVKVLKKVGLIAEDIAEELKNHAYFDIAKIVSITDDKVTIKGTLDTLPEELRRCVQSIKPTKEGLEIKFVNRQNALKMLGQYKGMFVEKHQHEHTGQFRTILELVNHATRDKSK